MTQPFALHKMHQIADAEYLLYKAGLDWSTSNQGVHLLVYDNGKHVAHLWPTTGKYCLGTDLKRNKSYGVGVTNLIHSLLKRRKQREIPLPTNHLCAIL